MNVVFILQFLFLNYCIYWAVSRETRCLFNAFGSVYFRYYVKSLIFANKNERIKKNMGQIISQPSALCFSSDIPDIVFSTQDESATLKANVVCGGDRIEVLAETVCPDISHSVSLVDLSSLLELYAQQHLQVTLECSLEDSAGVVSITPVTVLYAMVDVGESVSSFTSSHFLTILDGVKLTSSGREERLYAYGATTAVVSADVLLPSGELTVVSGSITAAGTTGNISQFDVSPSYIASVLRVSGQMLRYVVESGERRQEFQMVTDDMPPSPSLVFVNSFGCQEFIHCTGTHQKDSKYSRTSVRMRSRLRNIKIEEDRQFKANTGWLNNDMALWADELFRSKEVYLWVDGVTGREIVITDSKSEISNDDNHMPSFEFTYSYAQRIHNVLSPKHAGRVFDNTFDNTFR